ncbi:MAG TPA: FAD-dependent monooxygenase [Dongiaceae bacterium]|nr:FAD-dependent monooxygenase [Dongiaceae bacterium]
MDSVTPTHACIIGAGPSGLTLANELLRLGVPFELIERRTERTVDSKAFALHARSLEVFRRMGIADGLLERGLAVDGMAAWAGRKKVLGGDLRVLDSEFPFVLSIPQADTEAVLLDNLLAGGGNVHWGQTLTDVRQDDTGVDVDVRDGNGSTRRIRARWLVGCDGAHSQVRRLINIEWSGDDYDFEFMVADGRIEWKGDLKSGHTFLNRQGYVMLFPLPKGRHRIVINVDVGRFSKDVLSADLVNRILQERGMGDVRFSNPFWLSSTQGRRRIAGSFKSGRVLLAGDAAHVHSPLGGQGLNTGIQDAYQLAWRLAATRNWNEVEHPLLSAYAQERRQVAQEVLKNTDKLTRLFTARAPLALLVRNYLMPLLSRRRAFNASVAQTASGCGIKLTQPALVLHGPVNSALAGSRLLHASLRDLQSNNSVLLGNATALNGYELVLMVGKSQSQAFYEAKRCLAQLQYAEQEQTLARRLARRSLICTPVALDAVDAWPNDLTEGYYLDETGHLLKRYGIDDAGYLIVRPDGYIACGGQLESAEDVLHNLRVVLHAAAPSLSSSHQQRVTPHQWAEV